MARTENTSEEWIYIIQKHVDLLKDRDKTITMLEKNNETMRKTLEMTQSLIEQYQHGQTDQSRDKSLIAKLGELTDKALGEVTK